MHWADINAALIKSGWPPSKVARHLNVSTASVTTVTHGKISSYNIASFISSVTNIPLNTLWPCGRYSKPRVRRKGVAA